MSISLPFDLTIQAQTILHYFTATESGKSVLLEWQMTQGATCNGIHILHAADRTLFEEVGEIAGVCGSPVEAVTYTFLHRQPTINATNRYKLALGNLGFSEEATVHLLDLRSGYQLRPHPLQTSSTLFFSPGKGPHLVTFFSSDARILYRTTTDEHVFILLRENFAPGVYFFEIVDAEGSRRAFGKCCVTP
ncbi:MAG: hypothetical protein KBF37_08780 [Saprospiraceae bacterium]|nr:hypothetical protein [Saprospiraceae bacterium]MBP9210399.1 hypothetical protein [Saprospiraceae bacterium]MBV6472432.1 hypothetical protein [Saprospiraceae bacterium]